MNQKEKKVKWLLYIMVNQIKKRKKYHFDGGVLRRKEKETHRENRRINDLSQDLMFS